MARRFVFLVVLAALVAGAVAALDNYGHNNVGLELELKHLVEGAYKSSSEGVTLLMVEREGEPLSIREFKGGAGGYATNFDADLAQTGGMTGETDGEKGVCMKLEFVGRKPTAFDNVEHMAHLMDAAGALEKVFVDVCLADKAVEHTQYIAHEDLCEDSFRKKAVKSKTAEDDAAKVFWMTPLDDKPKTGPSQRILEASRYIEKYNAALSPAAVAYKMKMREAPGRALYFLCPPKVEAEQKDPEAVSQASARLHLAGVFGGGPKRRAPHGDNKMTPSSSDGNTEFLEVGFNKEASGTVSWPHVNTGIVLSQMLKDGGAYDKLLEVDMPNRMMPHQDILRGGVPEEEALLVTKKCRAWATGGDGEIPGLNGVELSYLGQSAMMIVCMRMLHETDSVLSPGAAKSKYVALPKLNPEHMMRQAPEPEKEMFVSLLQETREATTPRFTEMFAHWSEHVLAAFGRDLPEAKARGLWSSNSLMPYSGAAYPLFTINNKLAFVVEHRFPFFHAKLRNFIPLYRAISGEDAGALNAAAFGFIEELATVPTSHPQEDFVDRTPIAVAAGVGGTAEGFTPPPPPPEFHQPARKSYMERRKEKMARREASRTKLGHISE